MPIKPSSKEEEYFAKKEFERRRKAEEERLSQMAEEEKKRLKKLHYMHCPKCGTELSPIDYKGLTIDKCFSCNGVWLDEGELETALSLDKTAFDKIFTLFKR